MIKALWVTDAGVPTLVLGLSEANVTRLRAGHEIHLPTKTIGLYPNLDIHVIYGPTEEQIEASLLELLGHPEWRIVRPPPQEPTE